VQALLKESEVVKEVVSNGMYDLISGQGLLHCAARTGNLKAMELLLSLGCPVDAEDGHALTALQVLHIRPSSTWTNIWTHARHRCC
jgi:ankyrin repeat protein